MGKGRRRYGVKPLSLETRRYFKNKRLREDISSLERYMLTQKVRLDDGSLGDVVTIRRRKGNLIYGCHLCGSFGANLDYPMFVEHFNGKTHRTNLKKLVHSKNKFLIRQPNKKLKLNIITPLPPCEIQKTLDECKMPLIGLEYLLEIIMPCGSLVYRCLLCDKPGTSNDILYHLTSQTHYMHCFFMFFRTATDFLMKCNVKKNNLQKLIEIIAGKIEQVYGRLHPRRVTLQEIESSLNDIIDSIDSTPHLWETPSQTFIEDLVNLRLTDEAIENMTEEFSVTSNKQIIPVATPPSFPIKKEYRDIYEDDVCVNQGRDQNNSGYSLPQASHGYDHDETLMYDLMKQESLRSRSPSVDMSARRIQSISPQDDKTDKGRFYEDERRFYEFTQSTSNNQLWQDYEKKVQKIENELLEELAYYQLNLDKHPKYEIERKEFWGKKMEEFLRNGQDPTLNDIKSEFVKFWDIRLKEIFQDILHREKAQLRQQLEFLNNVQSKNMSNVQPGTEALDYNSSLSLKRNYASTSREEKFESSGPSIKRLKKPYHSENSAKPTSGVIPVLRHLSVLDDHLGSLGPKVVKLLFDALSIEKLSENSTLLLLNEENCLILRTVEEKLKGLLQTGMLKDMVVGVAEKAIINIENLLNTVPDKERTRSSSYDRKSYSDERKLYQDEKKPYSDERKSYSDERKSYSDERKSYSDERKSYPDERKSYPDERKPYRVEKKLSSDERKSYRDERKPYSDETKSYQDKKKSYSNERKPYQDKRKPSEDEKKHYSSEIKPYQDEKKPYHSEKKPNSDVRKSYYDERKYFQEEMQSYDYDQTRYTSRERSIPQSSRNIKVSEINNYIEKLEILSHLRFLEKTSMAQSISSELIFQRKTDVTKDELLELIKTYILRNREPMDMFPKQDDYKQTTDYNEIQQGTSSYNQFSSVADTPAFGASLKALNMTDWASYPTYKH